MRPTLAACFVLLLAAPLAAQKPVKPLSPVAAADPAAGERVWRQCRACHAIEPGRHGMGPSAHGSVGAPAAARDRGRPYAAALRNRGRPARSGRSRRWRNCRRTRAPLPPGTTMASAGLRDPADPLNLIARLAQHRP